MIVVTGATGVLGQNTIKYLLTEIEPSQIVAFGRNVEKISNLADKGVATKSGEYSDYSSLLAAFKSAEKLFLISSPDAVNRIEHHQNAIDAAKEAGIKHIVFTAMQVPNSDYKLAYSTEPDEKTISAIKASGLKYTIVYNPSYTEYIPYFIGSTFPDNELRMPGGEGKSAYADREDLGEANAKIILHSDKYEGMHITLTGSESLSYGNIAAILSEATGNTITYKDITPEQFIQERVESGLPEAHAAFFAVWTDGIKNNVFEEVHPELENILGRKPHSVATFLKQTYA
ncbi:SDR family oxidoreductase [Dyadobacter sp. NIV53]|uniref:SDR family oxidoreductase n=1 Tax=Dyadobacter sp. NIV53 TaxID=2861765 RepID=UPI001C869264|nr:SDR family oxidoreductase [Dyadobacter sp. NIV53]